MHTTNERTLVCACECAGLQVSLRSSGARLLPPFMQLNL